VLTVDLALVLTNSIVFQTLWQILKIAVDALILHGELQFEVRVF